MNKYVIGNMKMNLELDDIKKYLNIIKTFPLDDKVIFCPTSLYTTLFIEAKLPVGLQNINDNLNGAFTGEISVLQMKSLGIKYSIVGHSERRIKYLESDQFINNKVKILLENGLRPILCIGETKNEKDLFKTNEVLKKQVLMGLKGIDKNLIDKVIIAYEPVWSISPSTLFPTEKDIFDSITYIKSIIKKNWDYDDIPVLYGGSVDEKNIKDVIKIPVVDGVLVGGCSTKPDKFGILIETVRNM